LAVELASGEWEILQFRDAELIGEDSYRLSHLLRGQRGTDVLSSAPIAPGARIVVLDDALVRLPISAAERGLERRWRIGPAARDPSDPLYVELRAGFAGAGLRPFAPAHLRARAVGGDVAISWVRTTRIGGGDFAAAEVPLGEDREAYRVTIRAGGAVLRRAEVSVPGFTYTAAMQVEDGAGSAFSIGVAQLSDSYGYGPQRVIHV
ncbi:MAG TPA: host specificity protein, partial [Paracoccaceae bacterium]|nr:host specificity protein [Paracoccaceae bacterium]